MFRASSAEIIISCSFSPGRMPTTLVATPGAMAAAMSVIFIEGIFGTKISPPCMPSSDESTKLTPSLRVIRNRVMRTSVIGSSWTSRCNRRWKNGITDPREPTTLPYRTTENRVPMSPDRLLAATMVLSDASLVAP